MILMGGGFQMVPYEKIYKVTPVLRIILVKMIFYPVISLCPAFYCVQHFTVSSSILKPTKYYVHTYPNACSFVHLLHVNRLWSYHAALAKHLSFLCAPYEKASIFYSLYETSLSLLLQSRGVGVWSILGVCVLSHFSETKGPTTIIHGVQMH